MKQTLLRAVFFASILLTATACNDDDDDSNPTPAPPATFSGTQTDPNTGDESTWTADAVTAEVGLTGDLTIKARRGSDTLMLRVPTFEVRQYAIAFDEPFAQDNGYVSVTSTDTLVYSYAFDGMEFVGGGVLSITSIDSVNMRFDGEVTFVQFFNVVNGDDQFILENAVLTNIPYTNETFDFGEPGGGSMSLVADGTQVDFDNVTTITFLGFLTISGSTNATDTYPNIGFVLDADIAPGTYDLSTNPSIIFTYSTDPSTDYLSTSSGELTVTSNSNDAISGTFSFTAENDDSETIEITQGSFDVTY